MAAAIAFRALFSLLPVLVVATMISRTVMGTENFRAELQDVVAAADLNTISVSPTGVDDQDHESLGTWILQLVDEAMQVNVASLTWIGILVLLYSATTLMVVLENSFNVISRAGSQRAWRRRIPIYWFVLTVGPMILSAGIWAQREALQWATDAAGSWTWIISMGRPVWEFMLLAMILYAIYRLLPNAKVRHRHAAIGACIAAVGLLAGMASLHLYVSKAVSLTKLTGSLGLIPVFMFWVYIMCLVVLFGLQVAIVLQRVADREMDLGLLDEGGPRDVDVMTILEVAVAVHAIQQSSGPVTVPEICDATEITSLRVDAALQSLMKQDVVCPAGTSRWVMARSAASIPAADIVASHMPESGPLASLRRLQQASVAGRSIADLTATQST